MDSNKREDLKGIIDYLNSIYYKEDCRVTMANHIVHGSSCDKCRDYGEQVFNSFTVVYERN